jgi:hypothetical protein
MSAEPGALRIKAPLLMNHTLYQQFFSATKMPLIGAHMIKINMLLVEIMSLLLFLSGYQSAYAVDGGSFTIEQPIEKKIIEEEVYTFLEQTYDPPYEIHITNDMTKVTNMSPEGALTIYFSSILRGDVDRMLDVITENDRKMFKNKTSEEQLSEMAELKKQAEVFLKGNKIVFLKKMSIGNSYVIIDCSIFKIPDGRLVFDLPFSLELENNKWKRCSDCTDKHKLYPFLLNLNIRFPGNEKIITVNKTNTPLWNSLLLKVKKTETK